MKVKFKGILNKVKSLFKKSKSPKEFIKRILKDKGLLTKILIGVLILIIIIFILNTLVFSRLEKVKINEVHKRING